MRVRLRRRGPAVISAVVIGLVLSSCSSGSTRRGRAVKPRYPNVYGTAIAARPDNGGELFVPRHGEVTLTLQDGRRFAVPPSVETPGATGLLCRTRNLNRADGSYGSPCHLQALVAHGRAVWIDVIGAGRVGTAVMGSNRWLMLSDGTALPLPILPKRPTVNCPGLGGSGTAAVFDHTRHLVRVSVNEDGTLARVDCLSSPVKP